MRENPISKRTAMKIILIGAFFLFLFVPLTAEVRVSVDSEFYNTFASVAGFDEEWNYMLTGTAGLSFRNTGSRSVRGEVSFDFSEAGSPILLSSLKKLYIKPLLGDVLITLGKTRTTWGAGTGFNAGDIIFGSDSTGFDTWSDDPRSETAWLTSAEIPLGDFSFFEIIVLPGNMDYTDPDNPELPVISDTSAGGRISFEAGVLNIQGGYLYRGDRIADLGSEGQRGFISLEGIAPVNWHLSAASSLPSGNSEVDIIECLNENFMITGGGSWNHILGCTGDKDLTWNLEFLIKPDNSFSDDSSGEYGLYLYPSLTFVPGGTAAYSVSSIISPVDLSANTTAGINWNIYEELTLIGYLSVQTGNEEDVFCFNSSGGLSCIIGAKYSY